MSAPRATLGTTVVASVVTQSPALPSQFVPSVLLGLPALLSLCHCHCSSLALMLLYVRYQLCCTPRRPLEEELSLLGVTEREEAQAWSSGSFTEGA